MDLRKTLALASQILTDATVDPRTYRRACFGHSRDQSGSSRRMIASAQVSDRLPVRVLRTEDLIRLKIQAYQNDRSRELKVKADIQSLITTQPSLDWTQIKGYADIFVEWDAIQQLRDRA